MTTNSTVSKDRVSELMDVGAHFGYASARRHPSVKNFILGAKNKVEIFDLEKTAEALQAAEEAMKTYGTQRKKILFVSSKGEARDIMRSVAEGLDMPYVAGRWIGGTITNFEQIRKRVTTYIDLLEQKEKGELGKYTKKERLMIDRQIEKLEEMFAGIVSMEKIPDVLFVVDPKQEDNAVAEAKQKGIPVVAIASSDCDISGLAHAVPANDSARKSIEYITKKLAAAYTAGVQEAPEKKEEKAKVGEKTAK